MTSPTPCTTSSLLHQIFTLSPNSISPVPITSNTSLSVTLVWLISTWNPSQSLTTMPSPPPRMATDTPLENSSTLTSKTPLASTFWLVKLLFRMLHPSRTLPSVPARRMHWASSPQPTRSGISSETTSPGISSDVDLMKQRQTVSKDTGTARMVSSSGTPSRIISLVSSTRFTSTTVTLDTIGPSNTGATRFVMRNLEQWKASPTSSTTRRPLFKLSVPSSSTALPSTLPLTSPRETTFLTCPTAPTT
mmetsp:Transcript_119923/g.245229  ORF Transcript_119923/g.245229 Transcript_119923/m.245229 type:complete len:248 (+) Transcript_119923:2401-3144(+)